MTTAGPSSPFCAAAALLLLACAGDGRQSRGAPPTADDAAARRADGGAPAQAGQDATAPVPPPSPVATSPVEGPAWRWEGPALMAPGSERHGDLEVRAGGGRRCRLAFDEAAGTSRLSCLDGAGHELWSRLRRDASSTSDGALLVAGDRLIVARHSAIASGALLSCYVVDSGLELWTVSVWGLGPVAHSQYRNEVQLGLDGDRVVVYGWEIGGRYVEVRSRDGIWLSTARAASEGDDWSAAPPPDDDRGWPPPAAPPIGAAASVPFWWPTPGEPMQSPTSTRSEVATPGGGRCVSARALSGPASLECRDGAGHLLWADHLREGSPAAELLVHDGLLLEVLYHPSTTGASVRASDLATGERRYQRFLYAMGPISHSRWRTEVRARLEGGLLQVYGAESAGRYLEVLDPATGRVVGYRSWPRP